jgi:enoyl-[acyl-carrier protein] reductase I
MTSIIASKMRVPSRISSASLPDDASAAAIRQSPRANRGPIVDETGGAGAADVVIAVITGRLVATGVSYLAAAVDAAHALQRDASDMLNIDLTGKRALVAGVADDAGYGFAIAKELAEAGASVVVGTWPPALNIFRNLLERGKMDESLVLSSGAKMAFESIYPLDAAYTTLESAPESIRTNKRYAEVGDFSIDGLAKKLVEDHGEKPLDIVVHSLANGPEVKKALLDTSRDGYLTALSVSAYSLIAMVSRLGLLMRSGGSVLSLTYMASERVIPGYGGGMSSAKAALESDTRVLAFEAGRRFGIRVNTISAGPLASRAASAIGIIEKMVGYVAANSPLTEPLVATEVGAVAAFLASPLASGITGSVVYVDKGYHAMGMPVSEQS